MDSKLSTYRTALDALQFLIYSDLFDSEDSETLSQLFTEVLTFYKSAILERKDSK